MSYIEFPLQFKRQYAGALDDGLVFNTYNALTDYIQNSNLAYAGQVVAVTETNSLYVVNNTVDGTVLVNTGTSLSEALDSVFNTVQSASGDWNSVYSSVIATSSSWDSVYNSVLSTSSNWDSAYNEITNIGLSGNNITNVNVISANTIHSVSAFTHYQDILISELSGFSVEGDVSITGQVEVTGALSSNDIVYALDGDSTQWNSTYTTVLSNSAQWAVDTDTIYDDSLLQSTSGNWDSTYTTVGVNSASWGSDTVYDDTPVTTLQAASAEWDDTSSVVQSNSAQWGSSTSYDDSLLQSTSGDWNDNYTTVNANSATNWDNTANTLDSVTDNGSTTLNDIQVGNIATLHPTNPVNHNIATGNSSASIGGTSNQATGNRTGTFGGRSNQVSGNDSSSFGGLDQVVRGHESEAFGGTSVDLNTKYTNTVGGANHVVGLSASGAHTSVAKHSITVGGENSIIENAQQSAVVAGDGHKVQTGHHRSVILGGANITSDASDTAYVPNLNVGAGFKMPTGAVANYVLTTDANGAGTWQVANNEFLNGVSVTGCLSTDCIRPSSTLTTPISVHSGIDLNDNPLTNIHYLDFHTDEDVIPIEGRLHWSATEGTLDLGLKGSAGVGVMLGMEQVLRVKASNESGTSDITKGQVVYISGAQGEHPIVTVASNDSEEASHAVVGIAAQDITQNQFGYLTTHGIISGVDTSNVIAGEIAYLGLDGAITGTVPTTPAHEVQVGYCVVSHSTEGKLYVSIDLGFDLSDIHDVAINSLSNNDILQYKTSSNSWVNTSNKISSDTSIAVSDETTDLSASTATPLATFHASRDNNLEEVLIGVSTAPTGSILVGDVHINGISIFSTKPSIDINEKTSVAAATQPVLSTTSYNRGDIIELFCDQVGSTTPGTGLKFYFNQYYTE